MAAFKYIVMMIIYLKKRADAELTIKADPPSPAYDQNVTITCTIPSFNGIASYLRGDSNVLLTNCISKIEHCAPNKVDRYNFGATSTSIFVVISGVDDTKDSFPWKCQYGSETVNLTLTFRSIPHGHKEDVKGLNPSTIAAMICGIFVVFLILSVAFFFYCRKKKGRNFLMNVANRFLDLSLEVKQALEDEAQEYILNPSQELPPLGEMSLEQYWRSVSSLRNPATEKLKLELLFRLSVVVLSLPHSNADTERTFSILCKIQSDSREIWTRKLLRAC